MRERDIRNAIKAALIATNAFNEVFLTGLPERYGFGADKVAAAVIEPSSTSKQHIWDDAPWGGVTYTCDIVVTLLYRAIDPQLRDEAVERLLDMAVNAIAGQALVPGLTIPAKTEIVTWRWEKAVHPERRITATFQVGYLVEGWDQLDTSP